MKKPVPTPHQLRAVAGSALRATRSDAQTPGRAAIREALQAQGLALKCAPQIFAEMMAIETLRVDKVRKAESKLFAHRCLPTGQLPKNGVYQYCPVLLPSQRVGAGQSPSQRLDYARAHAITRAYKQVLRVGLHDGITAKIVQPGETLGAWQTSFAYAKTRYGTQWAWDTLVRFPADWRKSVEARGLATLGGMLTLSADFDSVAITPKGKKVIVYTGLFLAQARGNTFTVHRGYLIVRGDKSVHCAAAMLADGLAGMDSKLHAPKPAFLALAEKYPGALVSMSTARSTGACEMGIVAWCNRVGIDASMPTTVSAIAAGYKTHPAPEVGAIIKAACAAHAQKVRTPHPRA